MLDPEIIKNHIRVELDFSEDDALLETYATAAQRYAENYTGRTLYATKTEVPKDPEDKRALVLDDDITTAMLLLIGHWYANRESVVIGTTASEVPMAVEALLAPYRHFFFDL
ncbi:phage gp6-like head-tail connector protein [Marinobacter adhaerens]|uniref:Phage gp6-like head-tail connector protein n=1 Tax=Marinobacter adhaerens TaxID=1033846 RepID=A0A851HYF1_9GAMM|nr:head-tail connector protein [Marinobacter adhaerens]NWN92292.1 phage gp6-like head-tail connector protein [Marinobacter adhaerens]